MDSFVLPIAQAGDIFIKIHVDLWNGAFDRAWQTLSMDKKLIWIYFAAHTITILTIIEFFALRA